MHRQLACLAFFLAVAGAPMSAQPHPHSDGAASPLPQQVRHVNSTSPGGIIRISGINSPDRDNTPIVSADGRLLFFNSTRKGERQWARFNPFSKRFDDDIYISLRSSVRRDGEEWGDPINLGPAINSSEDDGIAAISPDGQTIYFNSLKKGWENDGGPFYTARLKGRSWESIKGIGGGVTRFFSSRPPGTSFRIYGGSISSDGRDFYFATTVGSSTNTHQIWVSHFREDEWGYPENLGPTVNDGSGSYAPYIAADGTTLYYSSGRPGGYGGDDIFVSYLGRDGLWGNPINIGEPINSKDDNAFLSIPASGVKAYFSMTIDGNEDIYAAPLGGMVRPRDVVLLAGIVTDRHERTPIEATIRIEDLATGQKIFDAASNSADGRFTAVLRAGRDYGISISAPGYVFYSTRYTIPDSTQYAEHSIDVGLSHPVRGENFVLNNIIFDYNAATLRKESRPELDRIVRLMKEHPGMRIEVGGHTDSIGSADYNQNLSRLRAEAVRGYLVEEGGIVPSRIVSRGYGFTRPVASNTTEEGRNQNRRSELRILAQMKMYFNE